MTRYEELIHLAMTPDKEAKKAADADYLQRRIAQELEAAHKASARRAAAAHYRLACAYMDLIENFEGGDAEKAEAAARPALPLRAVDPRSSSLRKLGRRAWPRRRTPQ